MGADPSHYEMREFEGKLVRKFNQHVTWEDVEDMSIDEAKCILSHYANTDGKDWSARPSLARACQIAIQGLELMKIFGRKQNTLHNEIKNEVSV